MKKRSLYFGLILCVAVGFLIFFYQFTLTDAQNLSAYIYDANSRGWTVTQLQDGEEIPLAPEELFEFEGTAVMRRTIPESWATYDRVNVDTGHTICVFVDDELVFSSFRTDITEVCELPLMQPVEGPPYLLTFTFHPQWVGKTMTLVTRLYENQPYYSTGIDLVSDEVYMQEQEAWANSKAMPGAAFGVLTLLLLGLFLFRLATEKKGYSLLLLALAAMCQIFIFTSVLHESPLPWNADYFFTGLFFLLPLLYAATKLRATRKGFFISTLIIWGVYFASYLSVFHFQLPVPYWFDRSEILCFLPVCILLYCCIRERRDNRFAAYFLRAMGLFAAGYLLLYAVSLFLQPRLSDYIIILFKEAFMYYCRPLLFWVYSTILFVLFILALWETLQGKLASIRQISELKLSGSLTAQSLQHAQQTNEVLATARHDELHHLHTIAALCKESPDQAADYIASLTKEIEAIPAMRFTENRIVNSILSVQSAAAARAGVRFEAKASLPEVFALPDKDISTVLMNLLENAVHAAAKAPAGKERKVSAQLAFEEDTLLVTITNSLPEGFDRESFRNSFFDAVKLDAQHGHGIRSVQSVVKRYGGELRYSADENTLTVNTVMEANKDCFAADAPETSEIGV